jgi:hypothetical protein
MLRIDSRMIEHVLVEPKITDNAAYSAWEALTRLGFGETLRSVRRAWRWTFDLSAAERDRAALRNDLKTCDVIVNPNKDTLSFGLMPRLAEGEVVVAVRDFEDGVAAAMFSVLKDRFGFTSLERLNRTQMWILGFRDGDVDAARAAARGLLVNAHFQEYEVLTGDAPRG